MFSFKVFSWCIYSIRSPEVVITILSRCLVLGEGEARADRGQEDEGEGGGDLGEDGVKDGVKDGQVIGSDHCG